MTVPRVSAITRVDCIMFFRVMKVPTCGRFYHLSHIVVEVVGVGGRHIIIPKKINSNNAVYVFRSVRAWIYLKIDER